MANVFNILAGEKSPEAPKLEGRKCKYQYVKSCVGRWVCDDIVCVVRTTPTPKQFANFIQDISNKGLLNSNNNFCSEFITKAYTTFKNKKTEKKSARYICPVQNNHPVNNPNVVLTRSLHRLDFIDALFGETSIEQAYMDSIGGQQFYKIEKESSKNPSYVIFPNFYNYAIDKNDIIDYNNDRRANFGDKDIVVGEDALLKLELDKFSFDLYFENIESITDMGNKYEGKTYVEWTRLLIMEFYKNLGITKIDDNLLKIYVSQFKEKYIKIFFYLFPSYTGHKYVSFIEGYETLSLYLLEQMIEQDNVVFHKYFHEDDEQADVFCSNYNYDYTFERDPEGAWEKPKTKKKGKAKAEIQKRKYKGGVLEGEDDKINSAKKYKYVLKYGGSVGDATIINRHYISKTNAYCAYTFLVKVELPNDQYKHVIVIIKFITSDILANKFGIIKKQTTCGPQYREFQEKHFGKLAEVFAQKPQFDRSTSAFLDKSYVADIPSYVYVTTKVLSEEEEKTMHMVRCFAVEKAEDYIKSEEAMRKSMKGNTLVFSLVTFGTLRYYCKLFGIPIIQKYIENLKDFINNIVKVELEKRDNKNADVEQFYKLLNFIEIMSTYSFFNRNLLKPFFIDQDFIINRDKSKSLLWHCDNKLLIKDLDSITTGLPVFLDSYMSNPYFIELDSKEKVKKIDIDVDIYRFLSSYTNFYNSYEVAVIYEARTLSKFDGMVEKIDSCIHSFKKYIISKEKIKSSIFTIFHYPSPSVMDVFHIHILIMDEKIIAHEKSLGEILYNYYNINESRAYLWDIYKYLNFENLDIKTSANFPSSGNNPDCIQLLNNKFKLWKKDKSLTNISFIT